MKKSQASMSMPTTSRFALTQQNRSRIVNIRGARAAGATTTTRYLIFVVFFCFFLFAGRRLPPTGATKLLSYVNSQVS
jgi:hypothetical protein